MFNSKIFTKDFLLYFHICFETERKYVQQQSMLKGRPGISIDPLMGSDLVGLAYYGNFTVKANLLKRQVFFVLQMLVHHECWYLLLAITWELPKQCNS